jgi:hypothetical protein
MLTTKYPNVWVHKFSKNLGAKGKGRTGQEGREGEYWYSSTLSLTMTLDGDRWSTPRPGHFPPRKDLLSIVKEAGWALGMVWKNPGATLKF